MRALVLLLALMTAGRAVPDSGKLSSPTSIVFQSSETLLSSSSGVYHMEVDLYKSDGSILFSAVTSMKTVTKDKRTSVVASGFRGLRGFKQINSTHIVVSDIWNPCLKMVNREDRSASVLAGLCGTAGFSNGNPGMFYSPWGVEFDVRNPGNLLITDRDNHALRTVNINTGTVSTVSRSGFISPKGMAWIKDRLLVLNDHYISEVVWSGDGTVTNTMLAGSSIIGNVDGSFSLSMFSYPSDIHPISDKLYLVADWGTDKLRLLDVSKRQVLPVCTDSLLFCSKSATVNDPLSVLKTADAVYVGQYRELTKLTGLIAQRIYSTSIVEQPCQGNNITMIIGRGESSVTVNLGHGHLLRLEPGNHQYSKDNCTIKINVENPPPVCNSTNILVTLSDGETRADVEVSAGTWLNLPAGVYRHSDIIRGNCTSTVTIDGSEASESDSGSPYVLAILVGVISGLLLFSLILTVIFAILLIKFKREVHNRNINQGVVNIPLQNPTERTVSTIASDTDLHYETISNDKPAEGYEFTRHDIQKPGYCRSSQVRVLRIL